ncbi:MAG: hypothetical protein MUF25_25790 [Pirellulaceae bacterium]|jgi:hypothetical protein|nr:hypothetical protein [Pirellulaceae bacterium]
MAELEMSEGDAFANTAPGGRARPVTAPDRQNGAFLVRGRTDAARGVLRGRRRAAAYV